jgi:hypothetical protein
VSSKKKIISNVIEVMGRKGWDMRDLTDITGLESRVVMNACSEQILYCDLNILQRIASALDVSIKELYDEIVFIKNARSAEKIQRDETHISDVTHQLINLIMQMSLIEKKNLLEQLITDKARSKRQYSRTPYMRSAYFSVKNRVFNKNVKDFSRSGVFIEIGPGKHSYAVDDKVIISMEHPGTLKNIKASGRITRIAEDGIGVEFNHLL